MLDLQIPHRLGHLAQRIRAVDDHGCWLRWGNDFQNPAMAQEDPMCWQAWLDNPNAMWNWNGLYRNGSVGNLQAIIPDGQLCSGGHTEGGRYNSLDTLGPWKTTDIAGDFTVKLYDQASHGADYFLVYVTRQGYDPTTQPLKWSDLQLVARTGKYAPSQNYSIPVSTLGSAAATSSTRSGRPCTWTRPTSCAVT
ncbi:putative carbohydrate-binding protein with CBM5 and CBM33 domain [Streptomyces sp. V4I2]|nr:putative carbohydrate-binding protein with CBM5 and CBM33 domain [Streptomyces sp. V4I2]